MDLTEIELVGLNWLELPQDTSKWWARVDMVMNHRVTQSVPNFFGQLGSSKLLTNEFALWSSLIS
jgi:hypothetical protein